MVLVFSLTLRNGLESSQAVFESAEGGTASTRQIHHLGFLKYGLACVSVCISCACQDLQIHKCLQLLCLNWV